MSSTTTSPTTSTTTSPTVIHPTNDYEVESELKTRTGKVIFVKFSATWCGPCHMIAPYYEQHAQNNPNTVFLHVDVDTCQETSKKFGISAMPTVCVVQVGQNGNVDIIDIMRGADVEELEELVNKHCQ